MTGKNLFLSLSTTLLTTSATLAGGNPACGPGAGPCDVDNGTPGCDDTICCNIVCGLDSFCCSVSWDALCVGPNGSVPGASWLDQCQPTLDGPYLLENWSSSGIEEGTTDIAPCPATCGEFSYDVNLGNPGGGVDFRTAEYSMPVVDEGGTVSFDWEYTGFHAFFDAAAVAQVFADGAGGESTVDLVPLGTVVSGSFSFSGSASIPVEAGFDFGFTAGGENFDSNSQINGTLRITNLTAPGGVSGFAGDYDLANWSNTGISEGSANQGGCNGAPTFVGGFSYAVDLGNPGGGVTQRSATFSVPADANRQVTFDWEYTGFHAFCCPATADLQLFADTSGGTNVVDLVTPGTAAGAGFSFSGSASITVEAGMNFGIIAGGQNFDSNSVLNGTVKIYNFNSDEIEPPDCPQDNTGPTGTPDGQVNILDLLNLLGQWGGPGSADHTGVAGTPDGVVNILDLLSLLGAWGPC